MKQYIIEEIEREKELSLELSEITKYISDLKHEFELFYSSDYMEIMTKENYDRKSELKINNAEISVLEELIKNNSVEINRIRRSYKQQRKKNDKSFFSFITTIWTNERTVLNNLMAKDPIVMEKNKSMIQLKEKYDYHSNKKRLLISMNDTFNNLRERYWQFDTEFCKKEISRCETKLQALQEMLHANSFLLNGIKTTLGHTITDLNRKIAELNHIEELQEELTDAEDGYNRKLIHDKLEEKYGSGDPRKLKSLWKKDIDSKRTYLERNAKKIRDKANDDLQNEIVRSNCRKLYIDGNNLFYNESKFIGLKPLENLIIALQDSYEIVLIFDSISALRNSNVDWKSKFSANVEVYTPNFKQKADQILVELASESDTSYILSNDRFIEYSDYEVITKKRLINHNIVDYTITISPLDISVKY